jgi:rhodanese-related sulfurtransferase
MNEIDVADLESLIASGARLIDVREPDEYSAGHVPGAISIPLGHVPDRIDECVSTGETTYLICRSGARSANACAFLEDRGFDVVNVVGGTMAWVTSGRSVVEGDSAL